MFLKKIQSTIAMFLMAIPVFSQSNEDIDAILSMQGDYKVTFEFAETFSPIENYEYHDRKFDKGIERIEVVKNERNFISLQHLLIVNDTMVIKHWRQDWLFEPTSLLEFQQDNTWKRHKLTKSESIGKWAQKVYQVDDSPRYEGIGTWVHVDGKHYWEGTADAPLPRREFNKRSDYNVMRRHSRMEITEFGFVLEQDNAKVLRENGQDKIICWEKGMEKFTKGEYNVQAAIYYWKKNQKYWSLVRAEWQKVIDTNDQIMLAAKVDEVKLYMALFELCNQCEKGEFSDEADLKKAIHDKISSYLI
jgi:hypothetical protein